MHQDLGKSDALGTHSELGRTGLDIDGSQKHDFDETLLDFFTLPLYLIPEKLLWRGTAESLSFALRQVENPEEIQALLSLLRVL